MPRTEPSIEEPGNDTRPDDLSSTNLRFHRRCGGLAFGFVMLAIVMRCFVFTSNDYTYRFSHYIEPLARRVEIGSFVAGMLALGVYLLPLDKNSRK